MAEFVSAPLPADCVPPQICERCAARAVFHTPTSVAAVYCECSQTGAELPPGGEWHVTAEVTRDQFMDELVHKLAVKEVLDRRRAQAN